MAKLKNKQLNIVVTYENTDYVINDLGEEKSPRFELFNIKAGTTEAKSNNPYDFDDYMKNIWKSQNLGIDF